MLIGYNNDVEHRGMTFHIQTEDRGANDDKIETQLFQGGAILDTKITSYTDLVADLEGEARNKKIKSIMKASHRSLFKNLLAGKYDEMVGLDPVEKPEDVVEEKTEGFVPGQDGVPQAAVELEQEGLEALEEEAAAEGFQDPAQDDHVDISKLKDKLADLKKKDGQDSDDGMAEASETTIMSPPPGMTDGFDDVDLGDTHTMESISPVEETKEVQTLSAEESSGVSIPSAGVSAWTGCEKPQEDLSLTELVEESLAS